MRIAQNTSETGFTAVALASTTLSNDVIEAHCPTLGDRTSIPVPQLMEITSLCLRSTYFQLGDRFYEQTDGAAMGSPLSPVIANLYLESLKETAIQSAPSKPKLWVRYVDDMFVIWPHGPDRLQSSIT